MAGVDWVEVVAENLCAGHLPESLVRLRERGVTVVPHGVSLGLGGADRPDEGRLAALAERVAALGAPLVTEHIAFVRAGGALTATAGLEAGHLLPVPRTRDALDVLCENVRIAQAALPVPLAVENIAALFAWPGEELTEGQFLYELADRTGVRLLIDVANLHTNHVNRGEDPARALAELPVEAIAYVHVAGGYERDGVWHDSHAHPVPTEVLDLLTALTSRTAPPGVLLERDDNFPDPAELRGELAAIREAVSRGSLARTRTETLAAVRTTPRRGTETGAATPSTPAHRTESTGLPRQRLALAQTSLLSALVAGTPAPEGFDRVRLGVQARALAAKRAGIVAKVAPELPEILGDGYRPAFLAYATTRPLRGGYRQDALEFADHLLHEADPLPPRPRRELRCWWLDRSGPAPRNQSRLARTLRSLTGR
ncbi:MbnB/TglH/ChrH family RiPP precursor modification enzyme [Streptomyces sp. S6]